MTLILSIAALLFGPVIYAAGRTNKVARRVLDIVIVITIAVIIFVHIIPEAVTHGGILAALIVILGIAFPLILERLFRKAAGTAHMVIVAIAGAGLILHALIDGLALLPDGGTDLAYAIIIHRVPVGMALWWIVRPNLGTPVTVAIFVMIVVATSTGYWVGDTIVQLAETRKLAFLQAFVSGSLLHVVFFGIKHDYVRKRPR